MEVLFKILRQNPDSPPQLKSYSLTVEPGETILDCLNQIKWKLDGSLAFRKNCRNTICGSCAVRINGRSALACQENIGREVARIENLDPGKSPEILITPLGNLPVIKDLVVDMQSFWQDLEAVNPYVSTKGRSIPEKEFLQTPQEREQLNQTGNCIMCGACYSECNAKEVNPSFVGPHALAKGWRLVKDNRDDFSQERLNQYSQGNDGVWGCTRCYWCNTVCPMDVAPMDQITRIKQEVLSRKDTQLTTAVRHRRVLVDLVKQGGWIDERKFGLLIMSNYFRDLRGLLSIAPLGWHLLKAGKFPLGFEPSEGTDVVRALIEEVEKANFDTP